MRSVGRRTDTSSTQPEDPRARVHGALAVACLAAVLGAGAALGQDEDAASPAADEKVVVKIGWMGEIDNLNPFIGWTNNVYEIYGNEYLLMVGPGLGHLRAHATAASPRAGRSRTTSSSGRSP